MKNTFFVTNPGALPEPERLVPLWLEQHGDDFNVMSRVVSGKTVKILGLRNVAGRLFAVRWSQCGPSRPQIAELVALDADYRAMDMFSNTQETK